MFGLTRFHCISYRPMFWNIKAFGHFRPASGGRKCQKAHQNTKTSHLRPLPGLYNHPLQRFTKPGKAHVSKHRCFWTFWPNSAISKIWSKLSKGTSTRQDISFVPFPRSLRPSVSHIQPGKESMTDGRSPQI